MRFPVESLRQSPEFRARDKPIQQHWHALLFYTTGEVIRETWRGG